MALYTANRFNIFSEDAIHSKATATTTVTATVEIETHKNSSVLKCDLKMFYRF